MPEQNLSERTTHQAVQPSMSRVKITLVALFPVFWLLAGQSVLDFCADCTILDAADSKAALSTGKKCNSHTPFSSDISKHAVRSRIGKIAAKIQLLPAELTSRSNSDEASSSAHSELPSAPPALAASWQFACRAALEPRAPSSVS